jgi:putative copper export protein
VIRSMTLSGHRTVASDHVVAAATRWAWLWVGATLAWLVATASELTGASVPALAFREDLFAVIGRSDHASAQVATLRVALVIALMGTRLSSRPETTALLVLGTMALLPVLASAPAGGAAHAGTAEHTVNQDLHWVAVLVLALQTVGTVVWVGGLLALVLHLRTFRLHLHGAVQRFTALASASVGLIAVSGLAQNALSLEGWAAVTGSTDGQLLIAKAVGVTLLVTVGLRHRQRTAGAVVSARLLRLVLGELVLMGAVVAVALLLNPVA